MTPADPIAPIGPKRDAQVAREVLGWTRVEHDDVGAVGVPPTEQKLRRRLRVSTNNATALDVLLRYCRERSLRYVLRGLWEGRDEHWCGLDEDQWADPNPLWSASGTTPADAITHALILAAREKEARR